MDVSTQYSIPSQGVTTQQENNAAIEVAIARAKMDLNTAMDAVEYQDISKKCQLIAAVHATVAWLRNRLRDVIEKETTDAFLQQLGSVLIQFEKKLIQANYASNLPQLQEGDERGLLLLQECFQTMMDIQDWWVARIHTV